MCGCYNCVKESGETIDGIIPMIYARMIVCETCGNKRCPHATNHELACTNSNETGQAGSRFENWP